MSNSNKNSNLDELLRISWLEDLLQSTHDKDVFAADITTIMPDKNIYMMINQLQSFAMQPSFGELLTESLANQSETEFLYKTELSETMLDELKGDKLAVNNVPVFLLKNLLSELRISYLNARSAILKTFEILQNRIDLISNPPVARPIFRKGGTDTNSESLKRIPNKDLFENEESLNKYLNRLEKLMQ